MYIGNKFKEKKIKTSVFLNLNVSITELIPPSFLPGLRFAGKSHLQHGLHMYVFFTLSHSWFSKFKTRQSKVGMRRWCCFVSWFDSCCRRIILLFGFLLTPFSPLPLSLPSSPYPLPPQLSPLLPLVCLRQWALLWKWRIISAWPVEK